MNNWSIYLLLMLVVICSTAYSCKHVRKKHKKQLTAQAEKKHFLDGWSDEMLKEVSQWKPTSSQSPGVQSLITKIQNGQPLTLIAIGGSNSAGRGLHNIHQAYFKQVASLWNQHHATSSKMTAYGLGIGAIGSDVFSFCFQNFLPNQHPDVVLIDQAVNDQSKLYGTGAIPMELLTRRLLLFPSQPLIIYIHLVNPRIANGRITNINCQNMQDKGFDELAKHYGIKSISMKDLVCTLTSSGTRTMDDSMLDMFVEDGNHISAKTHALIAGKVNEYLMSISPSSIWTQKRALLLTQRKHLETLKSNSSSSPPKPSSSLSSSSLSSSSSPKPSSSLSSSLSLFSKRSNIPLKRPLFAKQSIKDNQLKEAKCFIQLTPNMTIPIRQTLALQITELQGFKHYYPGLDPLHIKDWRHDGCGGWFAQPGPVRLQALFTITRQQGMMWRSVVVILKVKENFPFNVKIWLDRGLKYCTHIAITNPGFDLTHIRVFYVASHAAPGNHVLKLQGNAKFLDFLGIAIGYPGFHGYGPYKPFGGQVGPCTMGN